MKRFLLTLALVAALPAMASTALFTKYEAVRQGFLKSSLKDVQASAAQLAAEASKAKNTAVAAQANAVAKSTDLAKAKASFAKLSDEMIKVQSSTKGSRPAVYYCSMVKKSWLQTKGRVGNPYDSSMQMCGELKSE
jgi:hypothetical protein